MYSQAKVIAGGLAHIPVVIAVFYFILTTFNKRALKFVEEAKTKKPEVKACLLYTSPSPRDVP